MNELVLLPAVRQLELSRAGEVSIAELAEAHIAQIERLEPQINAFADFDAERVRAQARAMDVAREPRGPLHGLPVTVKSSIATAGYRCEIGSVLNRGDVPREDAEVVRRLRAAGALILGTTNCPEFLMAYETDNLLHGQTRNPWDLERSPGGSSGGESAAIAAGMSAAGLGSDSGGSVRVPAHFTGICSLKPTPGRVPGRGHLPPCVGPFAILGAIGPMARTIEDVSLIFRTLAGQDADDPVSPPQVLRTHTIDELRSHKIGFFEDDGLAPVTAETRAAVQSAALALREAGFNVEPFRPRTLEQLRKLWWTFFVQCGAMFYEPAIRGRREQLSPIFREFLGFAEDAGPLSVADLLNAWAELDVLRAKTLEEMREYPVLLCPAASVPAFKHGERAWMVDGQRVEYLDAWRYTQWFNALAAPAAIMPVGKSAEALPIGVQIAARPFEDEVALGVAAVVDAAFGYCAPPTARG
ncbi:amidase [Occallatibacter riparius]|uniref:Amidase n=1 Tax=Occallatibacter riparius TaxID=1002689 RepID=A0A9J7BMR1_9BACT|nr:amidase [Occallatibacter riparius]UWZ83785.1 amidase [Occallatibacter riparius]